MKALIRGITLREAEEVRRDGKMGPVVPPVAGLFHEEPVTMHLDPARALSDGEASRLALEAATVRAAYNTSVPFWWMGVCWRVVAIQEEA